MHQKDSNKRGGVYIDRYYKKANQYLASNQIEDALTALIIGEERGCAKCAFGILQTVTTYGSFTVTEDEARSIFESNYDKIKRLAQEGDDEAMVMVAKSIRSGFAVDDEPYSFWLQKAAGLGNEEAKELIREYSRLDAPRTPLLQDEERSDLLPESFAKRLAARVLNPAWAAEMPPEWEPDESRLLAAPEEEQGLVAITPSPEQKSEFSKESTLIADPDIEILERYGILDLARKQYDDEQQRIARGELF